MSDQATDLRRLIEAGDNSPATSGTARILTVSGGKPGVGSSTIAVNTAVALADHGCKVVLVDADLIDADVSHLCGIVPQPGVTQLLTKDQAVEQLLQDGPSGVRVLSGTTVDDPAPTLLGSEESKFVERLRDLSSKCDYLVIDTGNGVRSLTRCLWRIASDVLIVTTPDSIALMDAYAAIKTMADSRRFITGELGHSRLRVVVNQASLKSSVEVYERLQTACNRFLGQTVELLGAIPSDTLLAVSAQSGKPAVVHSPTATAAQAIRKIVSQFASTPNKLPLDAAG